MGGILADDLEVTSKSFVIEIEDVWENQSPFLIQFFSQGILENSPPGSYAGQFYAFDDDANDTHVFTLVEGEGDEDNERFSVDEFGILKTRDSFDFEKESFLSIRIRATDVSGSYIEDSMMIQVNDMAEIALLRSLTLSNEEVRENGQIGDFIAEINIEYFDPQPQIVPE